MAFDHLPRIRQRLAQGQLRDAAFDCLLPAAARSRSALHWTPVAVAHLVAQRLAEHGAHYVLDAGSGAGKFSVVAASVCPELSFVGIEQRAELVATARALAARLDVVNAQFLQGDALAHSWAPFDGFYFFNPFAENQSTSADAARIAGRLSEARRGSVVVTYHGLGGPLPSSYELVREERTASGPLRTWLKQRDTEENWVHLDHAAVSRADLAAPLRNL